MGIETRKVPDLSSIGERLSIASKLITHHQAKRSLSVLSAIGLLAIIAACGQTENPDQRTTIATAIPTQPSASPTATLVDRVAGPVIRRSPIVGATIEPTLTRGEILNRQKAQTNTSRVPIFNQRADAMEDIQ